MQVFSSFLPLSETEKAGLDSHTEKSGSNLHSCKKCKQQENSGNISGKIYFKILTDFLRQYIVDLVMPRHRRYLFPVFVHIDAMISAFPE